MDFQIDYMLFLAITGRKAGDYGIWEVDDAGIRSTLRPGSHSAHDEFLTRRIIERTKLAFPTSATDLRMVEENLQERITPEWFRGVVECDTADQALILLDEAKSIGTELRNDALKRKASAATRPGLSRGERVQAVAWEEQQARNAELALRGVELVEDIMRGISPTKSKPMTPKESGAIGGLVSNESNNKVRDQIIEAYRLGETKSKNAAAAELSTKFRRAESSIRVLLKGVEWVGPQGGG